MSAAKVGIEHIFPLRGDVFLERLFECNTGIVERDVGAAIVGAAIFVRRLIDEAFCLALLPHIRPNIGGFASARLLRDDLDEYS